MSNSDVPLFPLSTVVFPGGLLPMRIFEPRYLDMVAYCMKRDTGFVICIARPGGADGFAEPRALGTRVEIIDFDRLEDGHLGLTVRGMSRVAIHAPHRADNGQWWGRIETVAEGADGPCPADCAPLKSVVAALIEDTGLPYTPDDDDYESAGWLSARLTELLPFDPATKHALLATDDPQDRLRRLRPMIQIGDARHGNS